MYPREVTELAEELLKEELKTLLVALLIQQASKEAPWWVEGVKEALKGDQNEG